MIEAVASAKGMLMIARRRTTALPADAPPAYARSQLGPVALAWCAANLKGFAWPRVQRLASVERQKEQG